MQARGEKGGMDKEQLKYEEQCPKFFHADLFKYREMPGFQVPLL